MPIQKIKNYRWIIVTLLFFATTINYLDRQIIGLLKGTITGYIWLPMVAFEIPVGLWLLIKGIPVHSQRQPA